MSLNVFVLVLIAAVLHAMWNFAARKASGNLSAMWIGLWIASAVCLPFALGIRPSAEAIRSAWPYIAATGIIHSFYFAFLSKCYGAGDISFVYPVARGSGVAGTAVVAGILIGEDISFYGGMGIAAIASGILLLGLTGFASGEKYRTGILALLVGATIVGYSVVDKLGVGRVHPVFYIFSMFVLSALFLSPYVLVRHRGGCKEAWQRLKGTIFVIGLGSMGTYLIILFAFQLGRVSYIVAVREFSVVIGSALGVTLLNERLTLRKSLGILAIASGLILVKLSR